MDETGAAVSEQRRSITELTCHREAIALLIASHGGRGEDLDREFYEATYDAFIDRFDAGHDADRIRSELLRAFSEAASRETRSALRVEDLDRLIRTLEGVTTIERVERSRSMKEQVPFTSDRLRDLCARLACPELHYLWERGKLTDEQVVGRMLYDADGQLSEARQQVDRAGQDRVLIELRWHIFEEAHQAYFTNGLTLTFREIRERGLGNGRQSADRGSPDETLPTASEALIDAILDVSEHEAFRVHIRAIRRECRAAEALPSSNAELYRRAAERGELKSTGDVAETIGRSVRRHFQNHFGAPPPRDPARWLAFFSEYSAE